MSTTLVAPPAGRDDDARASIAWATALRLILSYFSLYLFTTAPPPIPGLRWALEAYERLLRVVVPWVGRHVLRLATPVSLAPSGSGDKLFDFVELFVIAAVALVITIIWSARAGRATPSERIQYWFRVWVRFTVGFTLIGYGMAKVVKSQFPFPALDRWFEPIGNQSPMAVLWNFMGYSPAYNHFTGAVEAVGGLLLLWQRTSTLGALVVAAAMSNVVALNFTYDVPVKLYSTHLLLAAIVLLTPQASRLGRFFLLNETAEPVPTVEPFTRAWMNGAALAAKSLFAAWFVIQLAIGNVRAMRAAGDASAKPPLYGIYEVDRFALDGVDQPALVSNAGRWRRVAIGRADAFTIQYMNESTLRFRVKDDGSAHTLTMTPARATGSVPVALSGAQAVIVTYATPVADRVSIDTTMAGRRVHADMRRIDETQYLLVSRGYHWINEVPFNR